MELLVLLFLLVALAIPLGWWMHRQLLTNSGPGHRAFSRVEGTVLRIVGVDRTTPMTWVGYSVALLLFNLALAGMAYGVFVAQGVLPLNPEGVVGLDWDLAVHTAISFVTNTNQQHYSGQAQLSWLSQCVAIVTLQFLTPATGLAALLAVLRALTGGVEPTPGEGARRVLVGNFWEDVTRVTARVLLPLAVLWTVGLASQGVPATWQGGIDVELVAPAPEGPTTQHIPLGPVAPMVAIKQLGTNGGGWFGPNSASPLENPTPFSNLLQTLAILLIPVASVGMLGWMPGRRRLAWSIAGVMTLLSLPLVALVLWAETLPNPAFDGLAALGPNWEGKETRLGIDASALWASLTTQTSNGSVNAMHDSLHPLGGLAPLAGMFINAAWGGVGVGLINYLLFLILTVFLAGLMVGRSPEWDGRRLEARDVKLLSVALLLQPLLVLGLTAITLTQPALQGISNPGPHGISQVLYEYASAYANNGSGFEGLGDDTPWWNLTCAFVLALGRYIPLLAPLAIAASLGGRRAAPVSAGTLRTDRVAFALTTAAVIVLLQLLNFLPALVLGPIAEYVQVSQPAADVSAGTIPSASEEDSE